MVEFAAKQTPILSVLIWKLPPRHLYAELQQNPNLTSQRTKLYQRESSAKHSNTTHQASRNTATSASIFSPFSCPFFFQFLLFWRSPLWLFSCHHPVFIKHVRFTLSQSDCKNVNSFKWHIRFTTPVWTLLLTQAMTLTHNFNWVVYIFLSLGWLHLSGYD